VPRSQKDKDWDVLVETLVAERGWNTSRGFTYRTSGPYIYWFSMLRPRRDVLTGRLHTKPLELDPVFWDIVGLTELRSKREQFRVSGSFTLPMPAIATFDQPFDDDDASDAAAKAAAELHLAFSEQSNRLQSLADFEQILESQLVTNEPMNSARIVWLVAMGRCDDALDFVRQRLDAGKRGGPDSPKATRISWL